MDAIHVELTYPLDAIGLEVKAHVEIHVAFSFGLEVFASVQLAIAFAIGVIMENSISMATKVMACIWCGIAFLRSSGEKTFQPK